MLPRISSLALAVLALVVAGCGGSDDTGSNSGNGSGSAKPVTPALTKSELVTKADAICQDMQDELDDVPSPESLSDLAAAYGTAFDASASALKDLNSLTPPADLEGDYNSWTDKLEEMNELTAEIRDAAKSGSQSKVDEISSSMGAIDSEANKVGKQLGFKVCAK